MLRRSCRYTLLVLALAVGACNSPSWQQAPSDAPAAVELREAINAIRDLPGYRYSVSSPYLGLTLTGEVAAPDRRGWTVSETGHPERVVARWVLADDDAYTDLYGAWERVEGVPFEASSPIAFGDEPALAQLLEGGGRGHGTIVRREAAELGGRPAERYDVEYTAEGAPVAAERVWVARDGGHLLRYEIEYAPNGGLFFGIPVSIEVTPLDDAPRIAAPRIGDRAYEGTTPPWRAAWLGQAALERLAAYRFARVDRSGGEPPHVAAVEGRISARQGEVRGRFTGEPGMAFAYVGDALWDRDRGGPWRRIEDLEHPPGIAAWALPDSVPTAPPLQHLDYLRSAPRVFGVSRVHADDAPPTAGVPLIEEYVGAESTNGVRTLHYRGTIRLAEPQPAEEGAATPMHLWIAEDGGYLVRSRIGPRVHGGRDVTQVDIFDAGVPFTIQPRTP